MNLNFLVWEVLFWFKIHWSWFLRVKLRRSHHWFRWWLATFQCQVLGTQTWFWEKFWEKKNLYSGRIFQQQTPYFQNVILKFRKSLRVCMYSNIHTKWHSKEKDIQQIFCSKHLFTFIYIFVKNWWITWKCTLWNDITTTRFFFSDDFKIYDIHGNISDFYYQISKPNTRYNTSITNTPSISWTQISWHNIA